MNKRFLTKTLSIIIAAAMMIALLPTGLISVSAATAESGKCGDNLTWNLDSAGNLIISGTGTMNNYFSSTVGPWGSGIKTVTIRSGVTSIGEKAFYYCTGLTSVTIPDGVTSIGEHAFEDCTGLTSVTIGSGVTSIGRYAFCNTGYYNNETNWENDVLYIGTWLIESKSNKSGVYMIKNGTVGIADYAFRGCTGLTSVTIPDSVTSIGLGAFYGCTDLTSVTIPDGVTSIGNYAFYGCKRLTSVTIGDGVASIGGHAFCDCTGLTSVTIPNSVTSIGRYAFYNTGYHNNEANWEDDVLYIDNWLIEAKNGISGAYTIKNGTVGVASYAFGWRDGLTSVTIPDSVTSIGLGAFYGCKRLTSVTIGDGVASIGDYAFYGCTGLTSVTIGYGVTSIGYHAFRGCTGLTSVTMGSGVASIGWGAFYDCTGLTSVTIPNSVTSIGDNAFYRCSGLTSVTIGSDVASIGSRAFYGCIGLTSVTIPDSVTSIGDLAFSGCTGLTSVTIPDSVTSIGDSAFYGCTDLTSITIPDGVTSIGNYAFYGCKRLTSVTIGNGVTSIGEHAFHYYSNGGYKPLDVILTVVENSYAHRYAADEGFQYELETCYPHEWSEWETTAEPTCTEAGEKMRVCSLCGKYDTRSINPLGHRWGEWDYISQATCAASGEKKHICNVCGAYEVREIMPLPHEWSEWRITVPNTYNSEGEETRACSSCGLRETRLIPVASLTDIVLTKLPAKLRYLVDKDQLDISGGAITIYFDNDTTREAYMVYNDGQTNLMFADDFSVAPFTVSGFDNRFAGACAVTVTYQGHSAAFEVEIVDKEIVGISVAKTPNKTVYEAGEALELTGGRLMLSYNNDTYQYANLITVAGVTRMVIEGESASREVSVSGFDSQWGGVKTVVIAYEGFEASFEVTVNGPAAVAKGDSDGDGKITVSDALAALRIAAKLVVPTDEDLLILDIDGDGAITVSDALAILRVAARLVDSL